MTSEMFEHLESRTLMSVAHPIATVKPSTAAATAIDVNLNGGPDGENVQGGPSDNTPDNLETNNETAVDSESSSISATRTIKKTSAGTVAAKTHRHHVAKHHARHR